MKKAGKHLPKRKTTFICLAILLLLLSVWIYQGNTSIGSTEYLLTPGNLPAAFDGFTIAQISDLHNAVFGKDQEKLIAALKSAAPDIIVITGDLIDSRHTKLEIAKETVKQAAKIAPLYYVTGNHEARVPAAFQALEAEMRALGVQVLRNAAVEISREGQSIQIIGLDDPSFSFYGEPTVVALQELTQDSAGESYRILLAHRPELFAAYCAAGVDLVFSGHAHGGQFRLPWIGGLIAPGQGLLPKYTEGCFEEGDTTMVVSRGLGNSIFPFRINNPPELVVVTLRAQAGD